MCARLMLNLIRHLIYGRLTKSYLVLRNDLQRGHYITCYPGESSELGKKYLVQGPATDE